MFAIRALALALFAFALTPFVAPVSAQSLSPELRALEEQLPGRLVNDPSRIDWESYGPEFFAESFQDDQIPGGAARRFHVNKATEFIYTAGTNIPLIRNVKRGEQITIGFYARTVEASTDDGKGVLRVRFQKDSPPYPGFGEKTLEIGTEWDWYEVTAEAEQALRRKDGIVSIQFGRTKQVLEIGQAIVVSGASSIIRGTSEPAAKPDPVVEAIAAVELPRPLQGQGSLINDPTARDWTMTATNGGSQSRDDPSIWLGKSTQMATNEGTDGESMVQGLIRVPNAIGEGDEILVALAAKTVASPRPDGRTTLGLSLASPRAQETFSSAAIEVGSSWQLVRFVTKAERNIAAGEAVVALAIEGAGQAIDIGPVYVLRKDASIP